MTPSLLMRCTGCRSLGVAAGWLPWIEKAMAAFAINTPRRQASFLAQVGHESGGLRYTSELWGPTTAQEGYEGRRDLGNTRLGDGRRFRGHGLIQVTGRNNHALMRDLLRARFPDVAVPDFEEYPELLAQTEWAALSAGAFWNARGLNGQADAGAFDAVCDIINKGHVTRQVGDANGYPERLALWKRACSALGV